MFFTILMFFVIFKKVFSRGSPTYNRGMEAFAGFKYARRNDRHLE